jgi:hypothetical protein
MPPAGPDLASPQRTLFREGLAVCKSHCGLNARTPDPAWRMSWVRGCEGGVFRRSDGLRGDIGGEELVPSRQQR